MEEKGELLLEKLGQKLDIIFDIPYCYKCGYRTDWDMGLTGSQRQELFILHYCHMTEKITTVLRVYIFNKKKKSLISTYLETPRPGPAPASFPSRRLEFLTGGPLGLLLRLAAGDRSRGSRGFRRGAKRRFLGTE